MQRGTYTQKHNRQRDNQALNIGRRQYSMQLFDSRSVDVRSQSFAAFRVRKEGRGCVCECVCARVRVCVTVRVRVRVREEGEGGEGRGRD